MAKSKHVVKNGKDWNIKSDGKTLSSGHRTQEEARKQAVEYAKADRTEVVVHGRDGKIRQKDSYGKDPHPPKG